MTNPPDPIPYASHVAHGTGRTPIGIILIAAAHLLLGSFLIFTMARELARGVPNDSASKFFVVAVLAAAHSMFVGGVALLLKGRGAWIVAIVAFAVLAASETGVAAFGVGLTAAQLDRDNTDVGLALAVMSTPAFAMCVIVLSYLGGAKARKTFALPPAETPALVRSLPVVAVLLFLTGVIIGCALVPRLMP